MDRPDRPVAASVLTRRVLTVEEYQAELLGQLPSDSVRPAAERIDVAGALGRTLAADAAAAIDVPGFDNSGMDGYAVRWADLAVLPVRLTVVADVPAGSAGDPRLAAGECARIMTGAPLPTDADTVVQVELTDDDREIVTVHALPGPGKGAFIRRQGSSLARGGTVVPAGTRCDAGVLASLISGGVGEVTVSRAPRVAVASTGDELVSPGEPLGRGQIHDVNTSYLGTRAASYGCRVTRLEPLPDDADAFTERLGAACGENDLVIVTGGASVGDHDVARIVLEQRGAFRHVRMQPGKPQGWARWDRALVVALPGNPLSAAVSFELFVRPLIGTLLGARGLALASPDVRARTTHAWRSPAGRRQFVPAALTYDRCGTALVTPVHADGSASHLTTTLAAAEVLAVVPEGLTDVASGTVLDILRMR